MVRNKEKWPFGSRPGETACYKREKPEPMNDKYINAWLEALIFLFMKWQKPCKHNCHQTNTKFSATALKAQSIASQICQINRSLAGPRMVNTGSN